MSSTYTLTYHKGTLKFQQNADVQTRIACALNGLKKNPPEGDIRKMAGEELFRLRVGTFRVLFRVSHSKQSIYIEAIGNRGDVYKK